MGGGFYDSSNDLGAQSPFPDFGIELVFPDLDIKSDVIKKNYVHFNEWVEGGDATIL